jgi:predicted dehydrogenase
MEKRMISAGIVGAGFSATFHFEALQKVHGVNVDVKGVYDLDQKKAAEYAAQRGIRAYESLEGLLDDVDMVHACWSPAATKCLGFRA